MKTRLRTLERRLVSERFELGLTLFIYQLLARWQISNAPDGLDIGRSLVLAGFYLPSIKAAINYVEACSRRNAMPDANRLRRMLLPQSAGPA